MASGKVFITIAGDSTQMVASVTKAQAALAKLKAEAEASTTSMSQRFTSAGQAMTKFGGVATKAGKTLTHYVTLPIVGIGAASIKASMDFQTAMRQIQTQAGGSAHNVQVLSGQVLALAQHAQQGPNELAAALFHLKSVGMDNVLAMNALRASSKLAAVSGANLEDTTNALAGAWRSGIKGAGNFDQVVSELNATVGAGNMRMTDLIGAIGTGVLPAAKTAGLGINDVSAALALLSDEGMSAQSAATRLRMTFSMMAAPSSTAITALASIHMGATRLAKDLMQPRGLLVALTDLKDHLKGLSRPQMEAVLRPIFGGGRSGSAAMALINQLDVLQRKYNQIDKTASKFGADVVAQGKTAAAQWASTKAQLEVAGIKLGNDLLPIALKLATALEHLAQDFDHLSPAMQENIVKWGLLAAAAGPALRILGGVSKIAGGGAKGIGWLLGKFGSGAATDAASAASGSVAAAKAATTARLAAAGITTAGTAAEEAAPAVTGLAAGFEGLTVAAAPVAAVLAPVSAGIAFAAIAGKHSADSIQNAGKVIATYGGDARQSAGAIKQLAHNTEGAGGAFSNLEHNTFLKDLRKYKKQFTDWANSVGLFGQNLATAQRIMSDGNNISATNAKAVYTLMGRYEQLGGKLTKNQQFMLEADLAYGKTKDAIELLQKAIDKLHGKDVKVNADTKAADTSIHNFLVELSKIPNTVYTGVAVGANRGHRHAPPTGGKGHGGKKAATGFEGLVSAPTVFTVAESGPELVRVAPVPGGAVAAGGGGAAGSLAGIEIRGVLDTPWGPARIRGEIRREIASDRSFTKRLARAGMVP